MTLHKRHTHGRVFVGDEARELLAIHRRDSHGNDIRMNVPDGFDASATPSDVTTTVQPMTTQVSVIYVTLPQTFSGSAVYSTMTGSDSPQATNGNIAVFGAQASSSATGSSASPNFFTGVAATSVAQNTGGQGAVTPAPTAVLGAPVQAGSTAVSSSDDTTQDAGMSGGAKAGVAFGVLFAIALVFGLIFFCWRRKKNPSGHEEIVDEKHTSFVDAKAKSMESRTRTSTEGEKRASMRSTRSASTAPRLSLRPVTQFLPNLGGNEAANNRNTTDSFLAVGAAANAGNGAAKSAWERKPAGASANPFGDESAAAAAAAAAAKSRSPSPQANPFDEKNEQAARSGSAASKHTPKSSVGSADGSVSGAAPVAAVAAAAAAAGAPRSAPGPGPAAGANNVHRVQLDFKPSMEDELELRSGQLVRMLHEYDDGWALCIRMDRSQQGVAPRTCLSKLPVKPRPQGPPPQGGPRNGPGGPQQQQQQRPPMGGPGGGPGMPNGAGPRRPSNPQNAGNNMQQPQVIPGAMYPRPLTPTQGGQPQQQQQQQQQRPMQQQQQQQRPQQQQPQQQQQQQQQRPQQPQPQSQQPHQAPRSAPSSPPRKPVVPGQAM
jgi:hypothetical protein